jgi:3-hydroxyisobutyrate dehydrogenase-like beta-hydroxyacid dehydrogenase
MLYCNTLGSMEAVRLARAYDISEDALVRLSVNGSGSSWSLQEWGFIDRLKLQHTLRDDESALLDFLQKDMTLALRAAEDKQLELPFSEQGEKLMRDTFKDRWDYLAKTKDSSKH